MALNATQQWWVSNLANHSELNGGGFDVGVVGAGTNWASDETATGGPHCSGTNLVVHATDNTQYNPTGDGYTPVATDVGNIVRVSAGTSWTPGYGVITAQDGTYWTIQFATATAFSAAGNSNKGTWRMGGAWANLLNLSTGNTTPAVASPLAAGHTINVRGAGTDNPASADYAGSYWQFNVAGTLLAGRIVWKGYNGRPCFSHAGLMAHLLSSDYHTWKHFKFLQTGASYTAYGAIYGTVTTEVLDCLFDQQTNNAQQALAGHIEGCGFIATGGSASGSIPILTLAAGSCVRNCVFSGHLGSAITDNGAAGIQIVGNLIVNGHNTTGEILLSSTTGRLLVDRNTIDACAGDGIRLTSSGTIAIARVINNILSNLGGTGKVAINCTVNAAALNDRLSAGKIDYNCFYQNTYNYGSTPTLSAGPNDTTATDPQYISTAGGNWGIGANLKAKGFPGTLLGTNTISYLDPGVAQRRELVACSPAHGTVAQNLYNGVTITQDGATLYTGTLHASNISIPAGAHEDLSAGILGTTHIVDDVTGSLAAGGYTYGDSDAAKVLTTATGAGSYQPVAASAVQKGVAVGVSPAVGTLVGIVDSGGTQHNYGTCSSAQAFAATGVVHDSGTVSSSGTLKSDGTYNATGILSDATHFYATGMIDGSAAYHAQGILDSGNTWYATGIVIASYVYHATGCYDATNYGATGLIATGPAFHASGVVNSAGSYLATGILAAAAGTVYASGILNTGNSYAASGVFAGTSGTIYSTGMLETGGSYYATGTLDGSAVYHATGVIYGTSSYATEASRNSATAGASQILSGYSITILGSTTNGSATAEAHTAAQVLKSAGGSYNDDNLSVGNVRPVAFGLSQTGTLANLVATDAAYVTLENSRNNDNGTVAADLNSGKSVKIRNTTISGSQDMSLYTLISSVVAAAHVDSNYATYSGGPQGTLDLTNLVVGNIKSGVTIAGIGPGTFTHTADYVAIAGLPAVGYVYTGTDRGDGQTGTLTLTAGSNVWHTASAFGIGGTSVTPSKVGSSIANLTAANLASGITVDDVGPGTFTHTSDYVAKSGLPATKYVYAGIDRGDGTTGILHASNIAAAKGSGDNLAAGILETGYVVDDVTGSLSPGGDYAAGYAAGEADQLVSDKAAVTAGKADILNTRTILTVTGTFDLTVYDLKSNYSDPGKANVATGNNYTYAGVSQTASYPTTATTQAAQHATDAAFLETHKSEIIPTDTAILAEFGVTGTATVSGGIDPANIISPDYCLYGHYNYVGGTIGNLTLPNTDGHTADASLVVSTAHFGTNNATAGTLDMSLYGLLIPAITLADAIHYQCLQAMRDRIRLLALPPVTDPDHVSAGAIVPILATSIEVFKVPLSRLFTRKDSPLPLPCILITPEEEVANARAGTNVRDDVLYPCLVTCVVKDNMEPTAQLNQGPVQKWRELIRHAFINQRLPGVGNVWTAAIKPYEVVGRAAWMQNTLVTGQAINFMSREVRGLNL